MRRYIDADKLQQAYKEIHGGKRSLLIDTEPTADVVEVVRCKDCKYKERERCGLTRYTVREYDFCSYGERKEK